MHRQQLNNFEKPIKRAKPKKNTGERSSKTRKQNEAVSSLNSNLLNFLIETVKDDKTFDFSETGIMYSDAVGILKGAFTNSMLLDSDRLKEYKIEFDYSIKTQSGYYMRTYDGNESYSDCYIALSSVFGVNPLNRRRNSLTSLLEQDFCFPDEEKKSRFIYINVNDVIKSKGNSVFGPKREDIGIYNRKLYDSYTKEVETYSVNRVMLNLKFFNFHEFTGIGDDVLFSNFVSCFVFDGSEKKAQGDFFMFIHQNNKNALASVFNFDRKLFFGENFESFKSYYCKNKKKIFAFYIDEFTLFEFEFVCEQAAIDAHDLFFKKSAAALPPPIFGLEDLSNFL